MIREIAFSFYPVSDMTRARAFYEDALGLAPGMNYENIWVEYDLAGATLAICNQMPGHQPGAKGAAVALEVDDLDATLAGLQAKSVTVLMPAFDTPVCRMAAVADPDGNGLILHQRKAR